jgi:hypothetical protein
MEQPELVIDQDVRHACCPKLKTRLIRHRRLSHANGPADHKNGHMHALSVVIIDFLTMYPDARRRLVRVLGELEADHRTGWQPKTITSRRLSHVHRDVHRDPRV